MIRAQSVGILEEAAKNFLQAFLREYKWLGDIAEEHGVKLVVLQGLLQFLEKSPNLRKERELVSLGLVLDNKEVKLQQPLIAEPPFHISKTGKFAYLKNMVNGRMLCYLVNNNGMASIKEIPSDLNKGSALQTLQIVSQKFHTITIYSEGALTLVYSSGKIAQIRRDGYWIEPCVINFEQLSGEGFSDALLARILDICCLLSEKNKGGIFVVLADNEVKYCKPMVKECTFETRPINKIPDEQLIDFANIDGAVVLSNSGELLKIGQKLDAPDVGSYYVQSGRGTRHNSASKYSKATRSIAFVVSEDGPISVYFNGILIGECYQKLSGED